LAIYALESMRLNRDIADWPIVEAFRKAGLDDKTPLHWRMLMTFFCWSHFPPERSVGPRTFWSTEKYCRLLQEVHRAKPKSQPTRWENAACIRVSNKGIFKHKKKPLSASALRRALPEARDPKHNYALSRLVDESKRVLKEDHERRGHVWPPVHLEDTLARIYKVEAALRDKDAHAEPAKGTFDFDGADNGARLDLLNELRARNHDGLLGELLAAGAQDYEWLLKFLEIRRASGRDELLKAFVEVNDCDSFLRIVENVIAADYNATLEAVENAFHGDVDPSAAIVPAIDALAKARIAADTKKDEKISRALAEFYCEQLAAGKISLSQAMARAGMICRADLLGESCD
jgi:hypothetical protein